MSNGSPEKIHLIPDEFHIFDVGTLADGRLYFVDTQVEPSPAGARDFFCTFLFTADGALATSTITLIGRRGDCPDDAMRASHEQHIAALGPRTRTDIWVRPFSVHSNGTEFGLIPQQVDDGEWVVEFMPGNTLSFYAPWKDGLYDT